jgi:carbonic anhydrase
MKKLFFLSLIIILCLFFSCSNETSSNHHGENSEGKHWSYAGETSPEHWAEIEKDSDCDGLYQSPINIIENTVVSAESPDKLQLFYSPKTLLSKVENNGHSIQFSFHSGDSIKYDEKMYYLRQIHFHEPSEHRINGVIYPIEIHLVHSSNDNKLAVFSILGVEGEESQLFEFFKSFLPLKNGETKEINKEIDLTKLSLEGENYYSYTGSLTTPPCSEEVNWIVFKKPIIMSLDEVLELRENMPLNNYRNEQPLNGRTVYYNSGS